MPVSFSIKNVPDDLADALRRRAEQNHRSLQGELMVILQASMQADEPAPTAAREHAAAYGAEALAERATTSGGRRRDVWGPSESAVMIRQMRDGREFTIRDLYEYVRRLGFETPAESARWIREDRRRG
jgi:plasmid stability protein